MKKTAAISLLLLLLFNWLGYSLLSSYFEERADARLEASLDNDCFDSTSLISIKIPAEHLSYYNASPEFQRLKGEIEVHGVLYKYVGKRLYNDSVELLCIPNIEVMSLESAREQFFKLVNDLEHTGQGKKSDPHSRNSKNAPSVYYMESMVLSMRPIVIPIKQQYQNTSPLLIQGYTLVMEQPPEAC